MILTAWQNIVAEDRHRYRVICVGRRGGKTTLAAEEIKAVSIYTQANVAYIAPTYQQARDIIWEVLKKELASITVSVNESRLEIRVRNMKGGESMVTLKGWESIESLRGQSFDFLVIDEVAMMRNFWSSWQEVIRPTLTDRKGQVMFISTPKGFNHFYELYNMELDKEKGQDYKSFHFTTYDNPHMPKDEIEKAKRELPETRFAQEYLADFKKVEGLVYKEFDRSRHLYDKLPENKHYEKLGGVDFGFTHPAAVMHVYKDSDGHYWVEDEWYQRGRVENQVADYVLSCKFNAVYPDPENASAIEVLVQKHVPVRQVSKVKGSIVVGINKVRELLNQNKLHVNKKCINLIAEFESYAYPDYKIDGKVPEIPTKEFDDALDALRYVVYSEFVTRAKIVAEKPRPVLTESRYEGTVPTGVVDEGDITEAELAKM